MVDISPVVAVCDKSYISLVIIEMIMKEWLTRCLEILCPALDVCLDKFITQQLLFVFLYPYFCSVKFNHIDQFQ